MMSLFFGRNIPRNRKRIILISAASVTIILFAAGFFFQRQFQDLPTLEPGHDEDTGVYLGITYLPVTPRLSEYYGLGVDSGALVTEVVAGSPADRAGVHVGDVILSFNGARPEGVPLLGMMMACPSGNRVTLEVWREKGVKIVELSHTGR
ncbi:MAG: PDZ domain-containing protein [Candidatus Thorarchaeota archaeon]|jgi:predicted metalloprotease with PDZ domain